MRLPKAYLDRIHSSPMEARTMWQGMRSFGAIVGAVVLAMVLAGGAVAQDIKQMKLTDKQVQGFIASQKDLAAISGKLQTAGDKPDPALQAELEAIAKKHGFSSFAELDDVA